LFKAHLCVNEQNHCQSVAITGSSLSIVSRGSELAMDNFKVGIQSRRPNNHQASQPRLWCHIYLNQRHEDFDLVPRLIGYGGANTKNIFEKTQAKVRIRGKGSGHKEKNGKEAQVPLMVAITSAFEDTLQFAQAVQMMTAVLDAANAEFAKFCKQWNIDEGIASEDMYRYAEMGQEAENLLRQEGLLKWRRNSTCFPPPIPSGHTARPPIEHVARTPMPTIMETDKETINDGPASNDTNVITGVGLSDRMSDDEAMAEHIKLSDDEAMAEHIKSEVLAFLSEATPE
jgi:hypothetical protein